MFGWDEARDSHQQVYDDNVPEEHQAKFSHELISGAAAFEGMKLFEDHQRKEGQVVNHSFAKELLAGFVGGEVDKLAETKGEDAWDRHRTKERAQRGAEQMYDEHYGGMDQYDPGQRDRPNFDYNQGGGGGGYGGGYGGGRGESRREERREEREERRERRDEGYGDQGGYGGGQGGYGGDQGGYDQAGIRPLPSNGLTEFYRSIIRALCYSR
ncbi:uncharacterized protein AB675_1266 [Cyphellophora attinorum]|uniref:CipC-like antibiotic response protein n=1 Tax=Cyphellophora attinorum TaxID=1664694 RepID=A0A0N0NIQ9_9EURO|nr:uncharacterized protein AB675_1266 [Phialophora attinorum]KPI35739.1 hypothetical protein AB675_1266 [Phialophora attinorum]